MIGEKDRKLFWAMASVAMSIGAVLWITLFKLVAGVVGAVL